MCKIIDMDAPQRIELEGDVFYFNEDLDLHRLDGPAVELADGSKAWYEYGLLHRLDGPAVADATGLEMWYRFGDLHRDDGPAVTHPDGAKVWYTDGKLNKAEWFDD